MFDNFDSELKEIYEKLFNCLVKILYGDFGTGKSLSATFLNIGSGIYHDSKILIANNPYFYLSCFGIEFIPLISTSQLENVKELKNSVVSMDEIQKIVDNRNSMSAKNSFIGDFTSDLRKFNMQITGTTHYTNTIDVRMYNETQCMIAPTFKYKSGKIRDNFIVNWSIIFKNYDEFNEINDLNLENFVNFYDTNFKPQPIVINHTEYIDNLRNVRSQRWVDDYELKCNKKIKENEEMFKIYLRGKE